MSLTSKRDIITFKDGCVVTFDCHMRSILHLEKNLHANLPKPWWLWGLIEAQKSVLLTLTIVRGFESCRRNRKHKKLT